jgi:hypothetical protein
MASEETPQETPPSEGLTEAELEGVIGRVFDAKMEGLNTKLDGINLPDLETFKGGILDEVSKIITENKPKPVDEEGLLSKVGGMLDEKMKGISSTPAVKRVGGPLSRWLAGSK